MNPTAEIFFNDDFLIRFIYYIKKMPTTTGGAQKKSAHKGAKKAPHKKPAAKKPAKKAKKSSK